MIVHQKCLSKPEFQLWHNRLGHPGSAMMHRIISESRGHNLKNLKILRKGEFPCPPCYTGKLITRPSLLKVGIESPGFLERIHGDICGPIHPASGPFRYFMVLIDASTKWSYVSLLSTRNLAFPKLLSQIIRLRAHFPDNTIKKLRLDNAGEFSSQVFQDFCLATGIELEHSVAHVHTQNGLAESLIKRLQWIARPLLMQSQLPVDAWGHAILHAASLIRIRPSGGHILSPMQLAHGIPPNISHLRVFGCSVYVPIAPPQRTKMGPQRRLGIYVGYDSPSIIRYLEPLTGDAFKARFDDCEFDENFFPKLGTHSKKPAASETISWDTKSLSQYDPRTNLCEDEILKILHIQNTVHLLPDKFTDNQKIVRSHVPAANTPARIDIPLDGCNPPAAETSHPQVKRGRPPGSKDKFPRKRKSPGDKMIIPPQDTELRPESSPLLISPEEESIGEISLNYVRTGEVLDRHSTVVDDDFAFYIAVHVVEYDDDDDPRSLADCKRREDWPKWDEAIGVELDSLLKRKVFGPVVHTPRGVKPVGFKWVFLRKRNSENVIVRYKARLVAQGFSQIPGRDYDDTYSPVMDGVTFRFLLSLSSLESLDMQLMDVVTAYLYGNLDKDIYMKLPDGYSIPTEMKGIPRDVFSIKLQRSLYGLKQSGKMWYNRLSEFLAQQGFTNNEICPCIFIKKNLTGFVLVAVYVDDLNLIGSPEEISSISESLKQTFEMKDLGKTKYCLGLQIEHLEGGILVHQANYTRKLLCRFLMDKSHPLSTPMVVRSLDIHKDPFRPLEEGEELLGPEVPYLSAIGALLYLANCTRPDIAFAVNLLARHSAAPTRRHWLGVKHLLRYLQGSVDLGLFYKSSASSKLFGYADAGYRSDPHTEKSQTGFIFTYGGTAISWRSVKQTTSATSSNHAELLAIHEASRECFWLRSVVRHILQSTGLKTTDLEPTVLFEDNAACIAQLKSGFIKGDRTKHIGPKFFWTHDLQKHKEIEIQQIQSCNNLADLLTKSLPLCTFVKLVKGIGMKRLKDLQT